MPLALQAWAPLCERLDTPATIRAYPPTPDMTVQVTAPFTFTTSGSGTTRSSSSRGSTIISTGAGAGATATTASLTSILRDALAPNRNRALWPVLKNQFLHEVVPPFRGAPAWRERHWQRQRRRGHVERVCRAQTPPLSCALAITTMVTVSTRNAARFAVVTIAATSRSAHVRAKAQEALGWTRCSALARAGRVGGWGGGHGYW